MKRTIIAVAVAVGIAAAGGVAIYAASGTVDNSNNAPAGGRVFVGGPMGDMENTQHGEFQTGEITALTDDSVTVKSDDGYEQTYELTSDTQKTDNLSEGDKVTVIATTEDGKATARSVMNLDAMRGPNGGPNGGPRNNGNVQPPGN